MPSRYLRITKEDTYGVFDATADAADIIWPRLPQDNSFDMQVDPMKHYIRDHFSQNRIVDEISGRKQWQGGSLQTYLYPEYSALIFDLLTPNGGEFKSFTADWFDGVLYRRFLGCVFPTGEFSATANQDETGVRVNLGLACQKEEEIDDSDLPAPSDLGAISTPYKLTECKGALRIRPAGGSEAMRTKYNELMFKIENMASFNWDEDVYITDITYHGRDVSLEANIRYLAAGDRTMFEGRQAVQSSVVFTRAGSPAKVLTLDLKGNGRVDALQRNLPLQAPGYQKLTVQSLYDNSATTDFSFTYVDS